MKDVNRRPPNFVSLSELEYGSSEFGSKRVRLHLTKYMCRSNRDSDSKNANSRFNLSNVFSPSPSWYLKLPIIMLEWGRLLK